ncbi:MAG: hypothetical protein KatS3mg070_2095 [Meiothermus sp.]|uniref:hypothetical protein n=1 Tax=Meiothermus sp. TaxID=1955249 RepID=UPI0021DD3B05|nr:hypothetical protein [Meiothermus sp.]GIW28732.1 MAG: hypothetical protein KatS3mg070_2095 [Meiothermus sp.]
MKAWRVTPSYSQAKRTTYCKTHIFGDVARLILGFVPVIGDSVDLLEQLYNRASGRGVDPVIAFLAGAGLALDVTTGGAGDITAGLKGVYRFSKSSAGFFALQIRTTVTGLITGRARPSVALSTLRAQFQTVSTLFFREARMRESKAWAARVMAPVI